MHTTVDPAGQRLQRLEGWLREDPRNMTLLADACDAALAVGDLERAATHLQQAQQLGGTGAGWSFRAGRLALLRREWNDALVHLSTAQAAVGPDPGIAHDIGFAHFVQGEHARCRETVQPWCAGAEHPDRQDAIAACQALWLRASHQLGLLEEAWAWIDSRLRAGTLRPRVAGVASLIAIDRGDFPRARELSDAALAGDSMHPEALVARASVALAQQDPVTATQLLRRMLEAHPEDGRAWSALGMAQLQAGDARQAREHFERATQFIPGHIGTWHGLGWCCILLQDADGALVAFRQALALDGSFAESQGAVGLACMLAGQREAAERHLALADRLDRHNVTARYARAVASGTLRGNADVRALAMQLLDRPGLFGGRLSDSLPPASRA